MKKPIKNGKEVFAVLSMATVMSISMSVKVDAASDVEVAAESAAQAVVNDVDKAPSENKLEETIAAKEDAASLEDDKKEAFIEDTNTADLGSSDSDELEFSDEKKNEAVSSTEGQDPQEDKLEVGGEKTPQAQGAGETSTKEEKDPNYSDDEKQIQDYDGSERYKQTDLQPGNVNQELNKTGEKQVKDGFKFELKNPSATSPSKTEYGYQITIDKKTGQRTYTKIYVTDSGLIPVDPGEKSMIGQGDKLTPESPDVTYKPNENTEITASRSQRNLNYDASEETLKHINNKDNSSTSFGMKDNYAQDNPRTKFFGSSFALGYKVNPWPNENDKLEELKLNKQGSKLKEKVFVQGQEVDTGIKVDNIDANARERLVGQVYSSVTGEILPEVKAYIDENGNVKVKLPDGAINKDGTINEDSYFYKDPRFKNMTSLDVKFFARPRTAEEFKTIAETPDEFGETGTYTETGAGSDTINHKNQDVVIDKQGIDRYDHYNLIGEFGMQLDDTRYYDQDFGHKEGDKTTEVKDDQLTDIIPGKDFTVEMFKPDSETPFQKTGEQMNNALKAGEAVGKLDTRNIDQKNKELAEKEGVSYETFMKEDQYKEKRWNIVKDSKDISKFTITAPKYAKAGESVSLNVKYTYTNGSIDRKVFYFVVQESTYIKPEYDAQVNFPVNEQTSEATVAQDTKRISPDHYTLPDTLETDEAGNKLATDDKGNKWTVKVDEKTGKVSAKPVDPTAFDGGEKLTVPVIAHYKDKQKPNEDITEEANAYFVIEEKANMTARYNAKAGKSGDKLSSDVILNTEDKYNRRPGKFTIDSPTYTDDKGNVWNVSIDETTGKVTATVPNAEEGKSVDGALLNVPVTAHYYEEDGKLEVGTKKTEAQFVAYGTNGKVEKTVEVPFETKVEKDPNLKKGEIKVITEGKKGSKKVTYTIEDSKITKEEEQEIEKPQERLIHVGEGVNDGTHKIEEKVEVGFETEIQFDDSLAPGETKEIQKGEAGEKKRDITLTIEDGNVTKTETGEFTETKAPKKRIIKVGRNTEGKVEHKEELPFKYKVEEVDTLKKGEYKIVKPGKVGTKTTTWTIKNSKVEGEPTVTEDPAEDALIQVGKGTNDGTHEVTEKKAIDHKTVIEYDENLDAGQQEVVKEGNPGEQERTNTLVIKDGQVTETKEGEFKTTKEATDRVVKIGTKPVTKVVEKPFNTEYVYDENLESGKTEEVTPGKNGKVTITTTYDKDQKKVVTSETEEAGQNRVVKIGGKTNGTEKVKEEVPFDVEVRKDQSLKKGQWKYATDEAGNELKGEKGEQEKTLTIVNSKVTETSDPTVTKQPKKAVILIGEGTNDGTHEIKEKKELPFETRIEYDESIEAGKEVVTEGSPGEQERTNTLVIKDGKVTETKEGEFTTTKDPVDKVIKIGVKPIVTEVENGYDTEYEYDDTLEAGKMEEKTPGNNGKTTITTSYDKDQKKLVTKEEKTDSTNRVIRVGIKPIVEKESIPHNTEFNHNPELEAGTKKKIKDGTPGEYTITTTFNKETKMLETKVVKTKEPTNEVWEYGTKTEKEVTNGSVKVKSDLPYKVIIKEDKTMDAGTYKVEQDGEVGEKITTIKIKNSEEESRSEEITKEAKDKIIVVGTKPATCPIPEDPQKPGKEDPQKPGKEDPQKPGKEDPQKPGKEDPQKPGKEDPQKPGKEDPQKPGKEDPQKPGKEDPQKPGKEDPQKPGKEDPQKPGKEDPQKPGKEDPQKPGKEDPQKPGKEDPQKPGKEDPQKPGKEDPEKPSKNTPNKPGENPSVDPKNPPQESPDKPKLEKENELKLSETEKVKEAEKAKEADEEIETEEAKVLAQVKKEEDEEASRVGNEAGKANLAGDDKAPKTGDAGLMAETASAGLASGLLLLLGRFKRKKEDEE
ncbi:G5 domain-containing protein [Peptoniphilus harei]|uniref:G5 domain-containing protein n=1 Tax=Peptoniphilus harei TaxID=54005 RepID=UPI0021CB5E57|nr:G5 domain-containing protein [Peptoniphilus harei]